MDGVTDFGIILIGCIWCTIWGLITKKINENKGYEGGFAWGCWLGFIGLIVVLCKPDNRHSYNSYNNYNSYESRSSDDSEYSSALSSYAREKNNQQLLSNGGWQCRNCMRVNASYVTTCVCGNPKGHVPEPKEEPKKISDADEILKFKKLLDEGAITQEEYDKKKKQILGL